MKFLKFLANVGRFFYLSLLGYMTVISAGENEDMWFLFLASAAIIYIGEIFQID